VKFCEDCDYLHGSTRDKHPAGWLCARWPTTDNYGFLQKDTHADAPFRRCREINTDGCCPMFKRRPDGQMEMVE
jgi:hypothetical protein